MMWQNEDIIDTKSPYIIRHLYRGDRIRNLLIAMPVILLVGADIVWKMPKPLALDGAHIWGWLGIIAMAGLLVWLLIDGALGFNTEWQVDAAGITRIASSRFGHKTEVWAVRKIAHIDVQITGFERGTRMHALSLRNSLTYTIRIHLKSGRVLRMKTLYFRDAAARELKQIMLRLPNVPCPSFKTDDVYSGVRL